MPTLTDLSTIRDLCARYDFALSKGFGQNFIINPGICPRIADAAGIGPGISAEPAFCDPHHLNVSGATKMADYLGAYLKENYDLTDWREVPGNLWENHS